MEFQKVDRPAEIVPPASPHARQETSGNQSQPSLARSSLPMFFPDVESTDDESQVPLLLPAENANKAGRLAILFGLIAASIFLAVCVIWRVSRNSSSDTTQTVEDSFAQSSGMETAGETSSSAYAVVPVEQSIPNGRDLTRIAPSATTGQTNLPASLRVGQSGQWGGELERIWGIAGTPGELHFRLKLKGAPEQVTLLEVVVAADEFSNEIIDYETTEERTEIATQTQADSQPKKVFGDQVIVSGVVVEPDEFEYRITPQGTPIVRLAKIERDGEPSSQAIVGQHRSRDTLRRSSISQTLVNVLRIAPREGHSLVLAGVFQRWEKSNETILLALGVEGRAAEVQFPGLSFADFRCGERVEVAATSTGQVYQRVEQNVVSQRPYLKGESIQRPNKPGDLVRVPRPIGTLPPEQTASGTKGTPVTQHDNTDSADVPDNASEKSKNKRYTDIFIVSEEGETALLVEGAWQVLKLPASLPQKIKCVYVDRQELCWMGGENGAVLLNGESIKNFSENRGFPRGTISSILEDHQHRMWVSSWEDGIACLESTDWRNHKPGTENNQESWKSYRQQDGLCLNSVSALAEDAAGRLWIGACSFDPPSGGISILGQGKFQSDLLPKDVAGLYVQSMDQSAEGEVFIGFIGGMLIVEPNLRAKVTQDLPQRTPQATFLDSRNRLWAGTWGGGVVQIDKSDASVMKDLALPDASHVRRICEDADGCLWVAALEGLWKLEDGHWQRTAIPRTISKVGVVTTIPAPVAHQLLKYSNGPVTAGSSSVEPREDNSGSKDSSTTGDQTSRANRPGEDSVGTLASDLLTATGRLQETLRLEEFLNATVDGGSVLLTIETYQVVAINKDGHWRSSWRITGGTSGVTGKKLNGLDQGQLEESDMRNIASRLQASDLLNLPKDITERRTVVARPGTVMRRIVVTFGTKKFQATYQVIDPEAQGDRRARAREAEIARIEAIADSILTIPTDRPGAPLR